MHDVSLNQVVTDYLTGESIQATTYEDCRQALFKLLVEELGYPKDRLTPRVRVAFPAPEKTEGAGGEYCRVVDVGVLGAEGRYVLMIQFVTGAVGSYLRECLAAARLFPGGPVNLVAVTDLSDALLVCVATGEELAQGMRALPLYEQLLSLAAQHPAQEPLSPERAKGEGRILYAYSEFLYTCCSYACDTAGQRGARFSADAAAGPGAPGDETGS